MFAILHFLSLLQSELTSHLMLGLQQFYKTFNTHRYISQWKDFQYKSEEHACGENKRKLKA